MTKPVNQINLITNKEPFREFGYLRKRKPYSFSHHYRPMMPRLPNIRHFDPIEVEYSLSNRFIALFPPNYSNFLHFRKKIPISEVYCHYSYVPCLFLFPLHNNALKCTFNMRTKCSCVPHNIIDANLHIPIISSIYK